METLTITDETLVDSLRKLEPDPDINQSLRKLLVSRVRSELLKYTLINRNFERQYKMDFHAFRTSDCMKEPSFEVEQDYFDWELGVTKIEEMGEELEPKGRRFKSCPRYLVTKIEEMGEELERLEKVSG